MTPPPPSAASPVAPRKNRTLLRRVLPGVVSLAIVIAVFWYFLPQFTSLSDVWADIQAMTWLELGTLTLAALWNLVTYFLLMVATTPGLTLPQAAVAAEASTAVSNTIPGGSAVGIGMTYAMFESWGFSRSRSSVSLTVTGLWNNYAKLAMPVFALTLLALQGEPSGGRLVAGLLGVAGLIGAVLVLVLLLHSDDTARRVGLVAERLAAWPLRVLRRPSASGWDKATVKFRSRTARLLRARWHWISLATLVSHLSLYLVLLLALRDVGVSNDDVSWAQVLAVFAFARLLTAIPFTPGGLGVVELALITGLSAAGGARSEVTAAVLVFRALTYVLPIPLGVAAYVFWRRNRSWRRPYGAAPRTALVPEYV
jgi:putative heme transporter